MSYDLGIDVVVTNYRTNNFLKKFVDSYVFQSINSSLKTELIIIDVDQTENGYEEICEILSEYKDITFQYWPIFYNCGYSGACNFASSITNSEIIAFFNSDTQLFDTTLQDCYDVLISDEKYAIAGPLQINSQGLITHAGIFGTNSSPTLVGWQSNKLSDFSIIRDDAISVSGSAYFVKRSVWDEMANNLEFKTLYPDIDGAFLPTQHYYEETWTSYFARYLGYKVVYVGSSIMNHEWHKSSAVGSVEGSIMSNSRLMFQRTCDHFDISHD